MDAQMMKPLCSLVFPPQHYIITVLKTLISQKKKNY